MKSRALKPSPTSTVISARPQSLYSIWSQKQCKRQIKEIELLNAPFLPAQNLKGCNTKPKDIEVCTTRLKQVSNRFKFGNCIETKSYNFNERDSAVVTTPGSISGSLKIEPGFWLTGVSTVSNDGKISNEFTPTKESVYMVVSDDQGSNELSTGAWCEIPALQPMKQWEVAASVINMPSQIQGQSFSASTRTPMQHHKRHHRSISQPAISPCSYSQYSNPIPDSDQHPATGTGWRRDTRSATMYTRYRTPEFLLMCHGPDQESSSATSAAAAAAAAAATTTTGHRPQTLDRKYTGRSKTVPIIHGLSRDLRILTEDLSTKDLDSGVDINKLLKLRSAKELSRKKRLLDPEIPRPREHWYEMKSPQFHMEMRKNTEHLKMLYV